MSQRTKKQSMATTIHRAGLGETLVARMDLVQLCGTLQKTPHGRKVALVKAFAQKHETSTETIYRRMSSLPGASRRKRRADAGLSKAPLLIVSRRIAFKAMARIREARHVICAKTDGVMWQAVHALSVCDQQACVALHAELVQLIVEVEESVRRLRAYERRWAAPINTNVYAVSEQATGA